MVRELWVPAGRMVEHRRTKICVKLQDGGAIELSNKVVMDLLSFSYDQIIKTCQSNYIYAIH